MRTIRRYDPQSGITTVRDITLISTSGVTFNEYNELPEKVDSSDKVVKSNQAIANAIDSLYNQAENSNTGVINAIQSVANNVQDPSSEAEITADTLMVTSGEDEIPLNTAIGNLFQTLDTLSTNVNILTSEMSDMKTQISQLSSYVEELTAKVDTLTNTTDGE